MNYKYSASIFSVGQPSCRAEFNSIDDATNWAKQFGNTKDILLVYSNSTGEVAKKFKRYPGENGNHYWFRVVED